ncbi:MAG: hypothetical protein OEL89_03030 [Candidatus Peregrinibacteria bacterium]|nr:hypothetical protein [Candidatus Peregrinibacteria bacterium]
MKKNCVASRKEFEVTDKDLKFYEKIGVPVPDLCFQERLRRRMAWRNERTLYKRKCSATGKDIVSIYNENYPGLVYSPDKYWEDGWDAKDSGRDFDFNRPFFEQFKELYLATPQISLITKETENSEYTHDAMRLKNCYLTFDGEQARDCMYGETFALINDCMDFLYLQNSELCYEVINCDNCYDLKFSQNCQNCSESWFLRNCIGCKNCFGCSNLRQKQYYIYNQPHTKKEYEEFLAGFDSGSFKVIETLKKNAHKFWNQSFVKYYSGMQNENSTGDCISNCKDSEMCFDSDHLRDCKFCTNCAVSMNDCYDIDIWGNKVELCYDCVVIGEGVNNVKFSYYVAFGVENVDYSAFCWNNSKHLFGCTGMKHAEYCILNKQYSKEEYFVMRDRIIKHMKNGGEWGGFFPTEISPFAYNETVAQEFFPMTKEAVLANGWKWREYGSSNDKGRVSKPKISDKISEIKDLICDEVLACKTCAKNYKIQKAELGFYRKMNLPVPRKCSNCRHLERRKAKNPRELFDRNCGDCGRKVETAVSVDRPEKVLCEDCYLKKVN